ncbi:VapE domain-containing protein [Bacteroides sp. 214]|uniref:VapE domain-containing protein n=1 Tax=Bacteroides sp. 214 TaxID=2302935 RepID=UPI001EF3D51B|nr:VapE domain-containing protein [Bacteroides sp. 214]
MLAQLQQENLKKRVVAETVVATKQVVNQTVELQTLLTRLYEFRYNQLTGENEFKGKDTSLPFAPLGLRETNTICMELLKRGIACWDRDLARYLNSTHIEGYHPLREYLAQLPAWGGNDRLAELATRVSPNPLWVRYFRIWMLGMVNQWRGTTSYHANSIAPILISTVQGRHKSTFCKSLIPPRLQPYYIDNVELTSQRQIERKLSESGLINLDEFDKFSPAKMATLKNVMQLTTLHIRMPHQRVFQMYPRAASFIATSNRKDLLTDPTGSRRFICIEVEQKIDCTGINHAQIYAQLLAELDGGARHWLNEDEERELQAHNKSFYRVPPVRDVLNDCFRAAAQGEECLQLSAAQIFRMLKESNRAAMQGECAKNFGQVLVTAGMERVHTRVGNVYRVVQR